MRVSEAQGLGFAHPDVESLVLNIATGLGMTASGLHVIPNSVNQVQSNYYDQSDIPVGDYIIFDPMWVRQVIGTYVLNTPLDKLSTGTETIVRPSRFSVWS